MKTAQFANSLGGLAVTSTLLASSAALAAQPTFLSAPEQVSATNDTKGMGYPDARKIVADSRGNLFIAFRTKAAGDTTHIFVARNSNGAWGTPVQAENIRGYIQRVPSISVAGDDSLHISWYGIDPDYHTPSDEHQIKYVSATADGNWSSSSHYYNIHPIADTSGCIGSGQKWWQEHPAVQVGRGKVDGVVKGNVMFIAWESRDNTDCSKGQVRFYAKPLDGSASGFVVKLPKSGAGGGNFSRPTVVPSTDGSTLYLLAYGSGNGTRQIVWTQSTDGGHHWASWAYVDGDGKDQRHATAAVDAGNRLHVAWREKTSSAYSQIRYGIWNGSRWSTATVTSGNAFRCFPSISVFRSGTAADAPQKVAVTWVQASKAPGNEVDTHGNVMLSVRDSTSANAADGSWSTPLQVNARAGSGMSSGRAAYPSLRWSPYGSQAYIDVAWEDGVQGSSSTNCPSSGCPIFYARLNQGGGSSGSTADSGSSDSSTPSSDAGSNPADSSSGGSSTDTSTNNDSNTSSSSGGSTWSRLRALLGRSRTSGSTSSASSGSSSSSSGGSTASPAPDGGASSSSGSQTSSGSSSGGAWSWLRSWLGR